MPIHRRGLAALPIVALAIPAARPLRAQEAPEILASFPNGSFLENLLVAPNGAVRFTNYFARAVQSWAAGQGVSRLAELPGHPVSLAPMGTGRYAVVLHGVAFNAGPEAMRGQSALVLINSQGAVLNRIAMPEAIFPNGMLLLAAGLLLVVDSVLGGIWAIDMGTGQCYLWYQNPALRPDPSRPLPGVNGIKRAGDGLLLSHSAGRQLLRLNLRADGMAPIGALSPVAEMSYGVDDFCLAPDGTIYAATHAQGLAAVTLPRAPGAAAAVRLIPAPGLEGSTAVAMTPDGRGLYALGTGGLLEGGRGEAVLARLALG